MKNQSVTHWKHYVLAQVNGVSIRANTRITKEEEVDEQSVHEKFATEFVDLVNRSGSVDRYYEREITALLGAIDIQIRNTPARTRSDQPEEEEYTSDYRIHPEICEAILRGLLKFQDRDELEEMCSFLEIGGEMQHALREIGLNDIAPYANKKKIRSSWQVDLKDRLIRSYLRSTKGIKERSLPDEAKKNSG